MAGLARGLFWLLPALVVAWTVWGAVEYRRLKRALQEGRRDALRREYRQTIAGELLFGVLSLLAVGPGILGASPAFRVALPPGAGGVAWGLGGGMAASLVVLPLVARLQRRRGGAGRPVTAGDFAALLPRTPPERALFAVVALSAGVCEELLFRGYGLRLFAQAGLTGWALLGAAALAFGLAHAYQGAAGVAATLAVGLLLSVVYVQTGSLLLPMALHALLDLRALLLPMPAPARETPAP